MFQNTAYGRNDVLIPNFAVHCRNDDNLCGKPGFLHEPIINNTPELVGAYEELNNRCCGEVNEKNEIEELERDFFEIFQKIKKFNKRVYKYD